MRLSEADILIAPGLGNSGPEHWQRRWGAGMSTARFVEQSNWDVPAFADWLAMLEREIMASTRPVVLIGHSLGATTIIHAAAGLTGGRVRGAFLVSPPDLEVEILPPGLSGFRPMPTGPLPFASFVVASTTDPFVEVERAREFAADWGSELHVAGDAGHINAASGHGPWPEGLLMFGELMKRLSA